MNCTKFCRGPFNGHQSGVTSSHYADELYRYDRPSDRAVDGHRTSAARPAAWRCAMALSLRLREGDPRVWSCVALASHPELRLSETRPDWRAATNARHVHHACEEELVRDESPLQ